MGADIATCPPAVIDQLFNHPLTNIGLEKFLKDWEKIAGRARRSDEPGGIVMRHASVARS